MLTSRSTKCKAGKTLTYAHNRRLIQNGMGKERPAADRIAGPLPAILPIMENIMYNELVCRGYSVDVGVVDIFETDAEGKRWSFGRFWASGISSERSSSQKAG